MKTRLISALIILPVVLAALIYGRWPFWILVAVAVFIAGYEYARMLRRCDYSIWLPGVWVMTALWLVDGAWEADAWLGLGVSLVTLVVAARQVLRHTVHAPTASWALTLAGGLYLGIGGAYLLRLRGGVDGLGWTLTTLPVVWIADSGAYFVGRRWGRHKMLPAVSPGKSWEGYAGQVASGLLSGMFFGWLWPQLALAPASTLNPWRGLILGGLLAALTPWGDFFVSLIKRETGLKDSGNLIPGHGGAFDRIDSLLWAGVLAWYFVMLAA
ncbi:MAG: phosphatidate cytidylyltransferase [Anaerolineae bacterium]|nr:phosphatidate cytidylyltransferase [Anaerolineae bacterium]